MAEQSRTESRLLWVPQVLLAVGFAFSGGSKLVGTQDMVGLYDAIGVGHWFRYVTGVLEVAGAIGLLVPLLVGPAALGLVGVMIGAIATHLFVIGGSPIAPIVLLVLAAVVAWGRRASTVAWIRRFAGPSRTEVQPANPPS